MMGRGWTIIAHVLPVEDGFPHELDPSCTCGPKEEELEGGVMYSHFALDGREAAEHLVDSVSVPDDIACDPEPPTLLDSYGRRRDAFGIVQ